ncbi:MAG: autotransporter-associated beta strand repeat-containing protein [Kiritimatiellae bacterium]|nr:autotransporter-associated beta strand repeat-containing protein [Kiritimatiellia bacterium]
MEIHRRSGNRGGADGFSQNAPGQRDADGEGWLRLTHDLQNQSSFVYYTNSVPTIDGLVFSFDFVVWKPASSPAADGFVLALFNPTNMPSAGGYGGSLGYSKRDGIPGLSQAVVGFGFDAHGNFSNPSEGRVGGPGRRENSIAIRGPMGATRNDGYDYITGTAPLDAFHSKSTESRTNAVIHSARISIAPDKTVSIAWTDQLGNWHKLVWEDCDLPCPERVMLGFTAGTGGGTANQEIRHLTVTSFNQSSTVWDGGSTENSGWGSAENWVNDGLPGFGKTLDAIFNAPVGKRAENYLGEPRTVRSLAFTTNVTDDIVIRTTTTADGTAAAPLVFAGEGDGAAILVRSGTTNNITIGAAGGSVVLSNSIFIAHQGNGDLQFARPLTGTADITKSGSGTVVLAGANTYKGRTTLLDGAIEISSGGTLGDKANHFHVWGGALNLGGTTQTNHTIYVRNGAITNGILNIGSRLHYYRGVLDAKLTGPGELNKWESDTTLILTNSNTYTGATHVRNGKLMVKNVSGSGTGSGTVTVYDKAVIGGQGRVGGNLIFNSGSKFAFSTSGPLEVGGTVAFNRVSMTNMLGLTSSVTEGRYMQLQGGVVTNGLSHLGQPYALNAYMLDDSKYAFFTVEDGNLYVNVSSVPLSAALDIALYAVAGGEVMIELATINENGTGDIVVCAWIDHGWVEVGRVLARDVVGFGSNIYFVRTSLLDPSQAYRLQVVDEEGRKHETRDLIQVRSVRMSTVRLDMEMITLTFATGIGGDYIIQSSTDLVRWTTEQVKHKTASRWSELTNKPISANPNDVIAVRIPSNKRKQLFFRAISVDHPGNR